MKNIQISTLWREALLTIIVAGLIFIPRALNLGYYVVADEPRYVRESANFYYALTHGDLEGTHQIVHPGVTTMWIGAGAFAWTFPEYEELGEASIADLTLRELLKKNDSSKLLVLSYARLILIGVVTGLLTLTYRLSRTLVSPLTAGFAVLLIAFDPFYFAHSRFLVTDGLLASLMLVSLVGYFAFAATRKPWVLIVSAAAAGASWVTKVPGVLLIPAIGLFVTLEIWRGKNQQPFKENLKFNLSPLLIWLGVAVLAAFLLWPALWVDASGVLKEVVSFTLEQGAAQQLSPAFFKGEQIADGLLGGAYWDYYPLVMLWRATPVVLFGLVSALVFWRRMKTPEEEAARKLAQGLLLFVLVFMILMSLSNKKFDRYLLPVFPPLALASAIGWKWFAQWVGAKLKIKRHGFLQLGILVVLLIFQAVPVVQTSPYYLSYYNPLLGGGERAIDTLLVGWGEGLDEAARYLNQKPDKQNLHVYTFYAGAFNFYYAAFEPYSHVRASETPWYEAEDFFENFDADYIVLYRSQVQRGLSQPILDFLEGETPEHTITINGIDYAWIYVVGE